MIYLTDKEKQTLSKAPKKAYIVTYSHGKTIIDKIVFGKSCGAIPLADDVSVFAIYDETGVESFVCDFSNFISVVEKSAGKLSRKTKGDSGQLRIVQPETDKPSR